MNNLSNLKCANSRIIGYFMEATAIKYLEEKEFQVIQTNYRFKRSEIDIIALYKNLIVFFEVKYRKSSCFGHPENFLSDDQIERIHYAAEQFMLENNYNHKIRFDIVAITMQNSKISIQHFEDAF